MLAVKGTYDGEKIILSTPVKAKKGVEVIITFLTDDAVLEEKTSQSQTEAKPKKPELTEEQRRLLMMSPEEVPDSECMKLVKKVFGVFPEEMRKRWLQEIREEHRRSK